jgi:DNA repair protein RecO (recombination protein O)
MPLRETEAIVLRTYRLGEADKIASLFTRQMGRLRAVAAGARRPKSRYGSSLEPMSYIRLWIFERENRDLLHINSAEVVESFFDMQKDYRVQVAAQYVAEVAERFLPEREVNERAFRLIVAVLRSLKRSGEVTRPLLYFDYWMLRLAGILPNFERCLNCDRVLGASGGSYGQGSEGLLCDDCKTGQAGRTVPAQALAYAASARTQSLDQWVAAGAVPGGCREARLFLEEVIEAHAERPLATRSLLDAESGA